MKKIIKSIGISILLIVSAFFLSNLNSTNIVGNDLNLASLITVNVANAEQTLTCYGTYELGGTFVINKCYDCTQVSHVQAYIQSSKSTCTIP